MKIEVLYFNGCPSYEQLLGRVRDLLGDSGIQHDVELRRIESQDVAIANSFLGSPTLRVDDADVEPLADRREDFGLKCRLYRTEDGLHGLPPDAWILAAIRGAAARDRGGG